MKEIENPKNNSRNFLHYEIFFRNVMIVIDLQCNSLMKFKILSDQDSKLYCIGDFFEFGTKITSDFTSYNHKSLKFQHKINSMAKFSPNIV